MAVWGVTEGMTLLSRRAHELPNPVLIGSGIFGSSSRPNGSRAPSCNGETKVMLVEAEAGVEVGSGWWLHPASQSSDFKPYCR
jgi:hypothetical protein